MSSSKPEQFKPRVEIPAFNKELLRLEKAQTWFDDLTAHSVNQVTEEILSSPFSKVRDQAIDLARCLIEVIPFRQSQLEPYVALCKSLKAKEAPSNSLSIFRQNVITLALRPCADYEYHKYVSNLLFMKKLVTARVFQLWDCTSRIMALPKDKPQCKFIALLFFLPEASKSRENISKPMMDAINQLIITDQVLEKYWDEREDLYADNNRKLADYASYGVLQDSIEFALMKDDLDVLKDCFANNPHLSLDTVIPENPFLPFLYIQWEPTLAEYAAFFGSLSCLKWLLDNNAKRSAVTLFAVAGGHRDVIEYCSAEKFSFHGCLKIAAYYHRFELFNYVLSKTPENKVMKEINLSMCRAIEANNIRIFKMCLESGSSINFTDENNETPYFIAIKKDNTPLVRYIHSYPGLNKNVTNVWGKVPVIPKYN